MDTSSSKAYLVYGALMHFLIIDSAFLSQFAFLFFFETLDELTQLLMLLPNLAVIMVKSLKLILKVSRLQELIAMTEVVMEKCPSKEKIKKRIVVIDRVYKATMVFGLINCGIGSLQAIDHLPYKMWYPWNTENSLLGYWAAAFHQIFASTAGLQISIGINILPVIFMTYAVGFIEVLCEMLESLKKCEKSNLIVGTNLLVPGTSKATELRKTVDGFKKCVELHQHICKFVELIQNTFQAVFLIHSFLISFIMCTTTFVLVKVRKHQN